MFHGLAERYGWSFEKIEENIGVKLALEKWEIQLFMRGIARGEGRYHRKMKAKTRQQHNYKNLKRR